MNYSKENIQDLIENLKLYENKYGVLIDLLEYFIKEGYLDFGLSLPGTQGSAIVLESLKNNFSDVHYSLFISKEELLIYMCKNVGYEHVIAMWRLERNL